MLRVIFGSMMVSLAYLDKRRKLDTQRGSIATNHTLFSHSLVTTKPRTPNPEPNAMGRKTENTNPNA